MRTSAKSLRHVNWAYQTIRYRIGWTIGTLIPRPNYRLLAITAAHLMITC